MQLDLKLPMRRDGRQPRTFRTDRNGLIEDFGDVTFVYGYWDRHFGCWIHDRPAGTVMECIPDWVFLDGTGQGRSPEAQVSRKYPVRAKAHLNNAADLAFFAYFQAVPHAFRRLVSSLGVHQWLALDGVRQDSEFGEFVDILQAQGQINFLHVCFALSRAVDQTRQARTALIRTMRTDRRVDYLNNLNQGDSDSVHRSWTKQRLRLLYKLTKPLMTAEDITKFLALTSDDQVLGYASHAKQISLVGLELFEILKQLRPDGARLPNVIAALSASDEPEYLCDLIQYAAAELKPESMRRAFELLGNIETEEDVFLWRMDIEEALEFEALRSKSFPAPPFAGDSRLAPLTSGDELEHEARHMRNCLRSRALDVINGRSYFFHWKGKEEATVELSRDSTDIWGLTEALGRGNRPLSYCTREAIENHVLQYLEPVDHALDSVEIPKVS